MSKTLGEKIIYLASQGYSVKFDQTSEQGLNIRLSNGIDSRTNFILPDEVIKRAKLSYDSMIIFVLERMFLEMSQPNTVLNVDEWLARLEKLKEDEEEKDNERV